MNFNVFTPDSQVHEKTNASSERKRPGSEAPIKDTRFRRAANSGRRDKCGTTLQCTGNDTLFEKIDEYYNCYCDNECYETFQDCCPDFVKTCGEQKKTKTKNSQPLWKCLAVGDWNKNSYCHLFGPSGIWMIANCSRNSALDDIRTRCENAPEKFSFPVEDFLPVVGKNGFTYRNKHCAECNEETNYQSWEIVLEGPITPPKEYNLDDRLRFVLTNNGNIKKIAPAIAMPRRYCAIATYKYSCSNTSHWAYEECLNGPVETVGDWVRGYFKNEACALCNGETTLFKDAERSYGYRIPSDPLPQALSIVFYTNGQINSESTVTQVRVKSCPSGLVYDDTLEFCRERTITNTDNTLSDLFLIILWFKLPVTFPFLPPLSIPNINNMTKHLKSSLVENFALKPNQLIEFQIHAQNFDNTLLAATFHLNLTPYQELILANENNTSSLNISTESLKFLGLLQFTTNFTMQSGDYRFPVIKLISKQLACFQGRKLQSHEYDHDNISGNVIQKTTKNVLSKNQYAILGKKWREHHNLPKTSAFRMSQWCFCNTSISSTKILRYFIIKRTEHLILENIKLSKVGV